MPTEPFFRWCVMAGAARTTTMAVDQTDYGDGYNHRSTRGLNPVRSSWTIQVPFTTLDELAEYNAFLVANAVPGFWWLPPDSTQEVFVCTDEWSDSITDRTGNGDMVGTLQATFKRQFNPQPLPLVPP